MQAEVLTLTHEMSREEWLKARQKGIGGSDAAAIAGLSKWRSPIQVYMEKMDEMPSQDLTDNEAVHFGIKLEDFVANEFSERTGMKVRRRNAILRHPEHDWMLANVDRLIVGKQEGLECKTTSAYMAGAWEEDKVPSDYLIQCQHYMAVTGYKAWWIAVLIGGNKFIYKKIERDDELINQLIEIEKDFWENHVLKGVPPEIDGSEASESFLRSMYPESEPDTEIALPSEIDTYFDAIQVLKSEIKDLEAQQKEYENKIKQHIGEYEVAYSDRFIATWKTVNSNRFDTKRFKEEYPDLYEKYINQTSHRRFNFKEVN